MSAGPSAVHARIVFRDGSGQQATSRTIIVVAPAPSSGAVVAEGAIRLEPPAAGSRYIPFELPRDASRIDMTVDWASVLDTVDFVIYQGSCAGSSLCADLRFIPLPAVTGMKPVRKSTSNLSAGEYTIRIDNLGPGAETVRYEVRSTPR
jgi:hypothetical protein